MEKNVLQNFFISIEKRASAYKREASSSELMRSQNLAPPNFPSKETDFRRDIRVPKHLNKGP